MAGIVKYNLDNIISKAIHRPILLKTPGGIELPPLYARSGNESETEFMADGMGNEYWIKATQTNYNSPTNVRRLFIGDRKVFIQYYCPPINNGVSSEKYWYIYTLNIDEPLNTLAAKAKNHNKLVMTAAISGQEAPKRVVLTGTGLAAISAHWKMSNIEEIFITPSILASESIENKFISANGILASFLNLNDGTMSTGRNIKQAGQLALEIFESVNGTNIKNIRTRFPRLKTIGFISNLDKVMESPKACIRSGLPTKVEDINIRWASEVQNINLQSLCSVGVISVPFDSKSSIKAQTEFSIRPGVYKYDAEVLEKYVDKYRNKVLELCRDNKTDIKQTLNKPASNTDTKSEYERELDELRLEKGDNAVSAILQLTFGRSNQSEIDEVFNSMSNEGKALYRRLLGR